MDQHIDLSLADSMGYYRGNDIMIKVSPGRASPLEKRSAQRKEGGNLPGEMLSPPMPSFSAYNWDYEEEEKEVKKNYQVKAERQKVRKQLVASPLKDFASVTDLKKETRAREKMQRNIEDMRRYFKCWIKRDSVARKYACVKMQRWYRGSLQVRGRREVTSRKLPYILYIYSSHTLPLFLFHLRERKCFGTADTPTPAKC